MKLKDILKTVPALEISGDTQTNITALTSDSRECRPGSLFVAVKGFSSDGHLYINKAVENGASAVMCQDDCPVPQGIARIMVKSTRESLALAADAFYGHPSGELKLIGITGTNGKTTTVTLLYRLFTSLGYGCGLLSTIANYVCGKEYPTDNTTADPVTINRLLAEMVAAGCEYCFMEVSSIGIEQDRIAGLEFAGGIFSNLTHDHLDYHKTFSEYLRCKKLFFDNLPKKAFALTNIDDRNGLVMLQNCRAAKYTYSCTSAADFTCRIMEESIEGMMLRINGQEVWTRLVGEHNAYNLLAIYSAAILCGGKEEEVLTALSALSAAPGRMECIRGAKGITAVIDYAHTPDALENVLRTLRNTGKGRTLIALFGCGGDRDRSKRPEMAAVAEKYSDRIFVTSDNPRTEDPQTIIDEIRAGFTPKGLAKTMFITDRQSAIRTALITAPDNAIVLVAGKGHEKYQIIGTVKRNFDETEMITEIFKNSL